MQLLVIPAAAVAAVVLLTVARLAGAEADVDPETVKQTTWDLAQQWAMFLVAVATLYGLVVRPAMKRLTASWEARVEAIAESVGRVEHQVHPNGGKSAHDYARKAHETAERVATMVAEVRESTHHNSKRVDRVQGELLAQGWRQQELSNQFNRHESMSREALAHFREALALQGITLPRAAGEDDQETDT